MELGLSKNKKITLDFRKLTLFFVCVYIVTVYLGHISGLMTIIGSLSLMAMTGCTAMTIFTERKLQVNSYVIWYALFFLVCVISALYAPIGINIISSLYSMIVILVIGLVLSVVIRKQEDIDIIFSLIVIASTILMIYLFATGYIAEYEASEEAGKRFGNELTGNANTFASIFMISACASVYFLLSKRKCLIKLLCVVPLLLQLYGLVLAGSRKNVLMPFILIYLILIQSKNKNGKYNVITKTTIAVCVLFVGYWLLMNVPFFYENVGYRFEAVVDYETGVATSADASAMIRESMRKKAAELWSQSPILGNGLNAFTYISGFKTYSHNNMLEILCNQGLFGAFVYYSYYGYLLFMLMTKWKENLDLKRFFIGFIICALFYEYGAVSYYSVPNHMLMAIAGAVLHFKTDKNKENTQISECKIKNDILEGMNYV